MEGTARALALARAFCSDEQFFFGWGDILVGPENYVRVIRGARFAGHVLAVNHVEDPATGGAVYVDDPVALDAGKAARVTRIEEKPPPGTSTTNWNNAGFGVLGPAIWAEIDRLGRSERGEYELPQAIAALVAGGGDVRACLAALVRRGHPGRSGASTGSSGHTDKGAALGRGGGVTKRLIAGRGVSHRRRAAGARR
jgi:dTDP-glucose pyrophosphorylase